MEEDSNHDEQSTCPAKDSSEVGGKGDQGRNEDRRSNKEVGIPFVTGLKNRCQLTKLLFILNLVKPILRRNANDAKGKASSNAGQNSHDNLRVDKILGRPPVGEVNEQIANEREDSGKCEPLARS